MTLFLYSNGNPYSTIKGLKAVVVKCLLEIYSQILKSLSKLVARRCWSHPDCGNVINFKTKSIAVVG